MMRIAVIGSGGVGGYFGGLLAHAGQDVTFLARGTHLAAIKKNGLHLDTVHGDYKISPIKATDDLTEIGPVDMVLLCVKDYQLDGVIDGVRHLLEPGSAVLPLLNGVQSAEILTKTYGSERVLGGLCKVVSFIVEPGFIKQASPFRSITFGEWDGKETERARAFLEVFTEAGIDADLAKDIRKEMWTKFLFITSYSGVASVVRLPTGELRASKETMLMLEQAMREIEMVARAHDIHLDDDIVEKTMAFFEGLPYDATPSMQRDVAAGRLFELEATTGSLIRLAREKGIDTPVNNFLYAVLKPQLIRAEIGSHKS